MHDQLIIDKVERVTSGWKRFLDHLFNGALVQLGEVVDVFAGVLTVGDAKSEIKVESLEMSISEEMSFNHSKAFDGFWTDGELDSRADGFELQEFGGELITDETTHIWVIRVQFLLIDFCYYYQGHNFCTMTKIRW